jgi:hypothetical protein
MTREEAVRTKVDLEARGYEPSPSTTGNSSVRIRTESGPSVGIAEISLLEPGPSGPFR